MICDPRSARCSTISSIVEHIGAQIDAVCGAGGNCAFDSEELARAVEHFLVEESRAEFVDTNTLTCLAARALSSIGHENAARRLLLFGTGMVRPSEWIVTGEHAVWILDLKDMSIRNDAPLEILFFQGVQIVLESIADVWDESRGEGVLGLRHICSAASALLGSSRKTSEVSDLGDEIRSLCADRLDRIKNTRGWMTTPRVMNLDIRK